MYTYDDQTYSDLYKDVHGYRPRNDGWEYLSPVGKQIKWDSLCEALDHRIAEDETAEAAAVERFEARAHDLVAYYGAHDHATAIRWIVEGLNLSSDDLAFYGGEYICYKLGLPYHMQEVFTPACEDILRYELDDDDAGLCPTCGEEVGPFRDDLSRKEYRKIGTCQPCQDMLFDFEIGED
jgi:hypothetical protein|tara:strand:+ start:359 stop:898 length:540 start_codon:yes stop_codon:yes gene_type:complete